MAGARWVTAMVFIASGADGRRALTFAVWSIKTVADCSMATAATEEANHVVANGQTTQLILSFGVGQGGLVALRSRNHHSHAVKGLARVLVDHSADNCAGGRAGCR
jgi:hypothetical protein